MCAFIKMLVIWGNVDIGKLDGFVGVHKNIKKN